MATRVFLIFVLIYSAMGCAKGTNYDFEKQQAFEARFVPGMSRTEVEEELGKLGDYEFVGTWIFPNGDVGVEYKTDTENWGSPVYYFRFSPDGLLITLFPIYLL